MLIRRNDFGDIKDLSKGSNKRVWFVCKNCNCGFLIKYISYNKKKYSDLCTKCIINSTEYRNSRREKTKELWKNEEYRKKVSENVSKAKKGKVRSINSKKKPYYYKLKEMLENEDYILITSLDEYLRGGSYVDCICSNGHDFKVTYKLWTRQKTRCIRCKQEERQKRVNEICDKNNFQCKQIYTYNKKPYIQFVCEDGHVNDILLSNFFKGTGCAKCWYDSMSSKQEREVVDFLQSIGVSNIITSNREIIYPFELDIYLPNYSIAMEYNGVFSHSEECKDKHYHLMKTKKCERKNIRLIHIFEDEWKLNRYKVENLLKQILGKSEKVIYARNCNIEEINYTTAKEFCDIYHLQNYGQSRIKLGLFHNNNLVSVMTFSKPSVSKGNVSNEEKYIWELNRFCSLYRIIGGASKLLNYFKENYIWNKIYTYADRRWSNGNLYKQLGFQFIKYTQPNYWYWNKKERDVNRYHRYKFRKSEIKHWGGGNTEKEIMNYYGWSRI